MIGDRSYYNLANKEAPMSIPQDTRIVIIGAGCFGVSTAFHLLSSGYTDITILDRSSTLPAPDAASNDINRSRYLHLLGPLNKNIADF
jgi:sarcosine oxidase/L-pipecolate oxidase